MGLSCWEVGLWVLSAGHGVGHVGSDPRKGTAGCCILRWYWVGKGRPECTAKPHIGSGEPVGSAVLGGWQEGEGLHVGCHWLSFSLRCSSPRDRSAASPWGGAGAETPKLDPRGFRCLCRDGHGGMGEDSARSSAQRRGVVLCHHKGSVGVTLKVPLRSPQRCCGGHPEGVISRAPWGSPQKLRRFAHLQSGSCRKTAPALPARGR